MRKVNPTWLRTLKWDTLNGRVIWDYLEYLEYGWVYSLPGLYSLLVRGCQEKCICQYSFSHVNAIFIFFSAISKHVFLWFFLKSTDFLTQFYKKNILEARVDTDNYGRQKMPPPCLHPNAQNLWICFLPWQNGFCRRAWDSGPRDGEMILGLSEWAQQNPTSH